MKILTKLALAAVLFATTLAAQAGWVNGYYRSNGTYVQPYYRSDYGSLGGSSGPKTMPYLGGYSSSRDYVYRNPYAAQPSVSVHGYFRSDGTYVRPHVRTAPDGILENNLSYRGYGTIRVPRNAYGW